MKRKIFRHLLMLCILLAAAFSVQAAYAEEITLFSDSFNKVYSSHHLSETLWGNINNKSTYVDGTQWASEWGSEGWFEDVDDTMMVKSKLNTAFSENGSTTYIYHKLKEETLPKNSTVVASLDFRTADDAKTANTGLWYAMRFKDYVLALQITSSATDGFDMNYASTTSWPFNEKKLDRDNGGLKLEANTDYKVVITMSPNPDSTYQYSVELFCDGTKVGAGIINEYNILSPDSFTEPNYLALVAVSYKRITVEEPFLYLKNASVTAIIPETKPEAEFFPQKGGDAAEPDGDFYVTFNRAVENIDKSNVTVSGGAAVEDITMSEDGKRADFVFAGLKPSTSYDVKISGVKTRGGETEFDYDWSFSTVNSVSFTDAYFEWEKQTGKVELDLTALSYDNDFTDAEDDEDYINGNKFYTQKLKNLKLINAVGENGLGYKENRLTTKSNGEILRRLNTVYEDGGNITFKTRMNLESAAQRWLVGEWATMGMSVIGSGNGAKVMLVSTARANWNPKPFISLLGINDTSPAVNTEEVKYSCSDDMELELTLIYNSSDGYDARLVLKNTVTDDIYYDLTKENCLTKEQAMGLDTLRIDYSVAASNGSGYDGVRFKSFSAGSDSKKGITDGENKLYIDYTNITPDVPFGVTLLAVTEKEEDGANVIGNVNILTFENRDGENGTLEFPITLEGVCDGMKLKVYALNGLDGAVPLMKEVIKQ